jgi:hypothetical protein
VRESGTGAAAASVPFREERVTTTDAAAGAPRKAKRGFLARAARSWQLYLFLLPTLLYFGIFHYGPLYGAQIAFRDFLDRKSVV